MNTIAQRVINILALVSGQRPESIKPTHHIIANVGLDSLDIADLMMELENEFGININEDAFEKLTAVDEVIAHVADLYTRTPKHFQQWANDTQRQAAEMRLTLDAHFAVAKRIQDATAALDWIKHHPDQAKAQEAQQAIDELHACVATLAGDRAGELYSTDDEATALRMAITAGTACCADEVCAGPGWSAVQGALA